jgi:hypothetical protein
MKLVLLVAVPAGVVTLIGPLAAPAGTAVVIFVFEFTENTAEVPLNVTSVVSVKFVPRIVTVSPGVPEVGENDLMVGAPSVTWNGEVLTPVPFGVVMRMTPVEAPAGTVAVICSSESTVNVVAATSWNFTDVAPVKLSPAIVTMVPIGPLVGENDLITGLGLVTMKSLSLTPVPAGVVTLMGPVRAPVGTVAVIC